MSTISLSKGIFAFKGSKKKSNDHKSMNLQAFIEDSEDDHGLRRYKSYKKCWKLVSGQIQKLMEDSHSRVFKDIASFINEEHWEPLCATTKLIPSAFLVTGVNMPDHEDLFSSLVKLIRHQVSRHTVLLSLSECDSMKGMIKKISHNIMEDIEEGTNDDIFLDDEDEDDDEKENKGGAKIKAKNCNLSVLSLWYEEKYLTANETPTKKMKSLTISSPRKKLTGDAQSAWHAKPPLVVIMENVESVNKKVLEEFICHCSKYRGKLPIVLIFGVTTTLGSMNMIFQHDVSTLLSVETFRSISSTELLATITDEILLSPNIPFRLGHRLFLHLRDTFYKYDLSINNFTSALKFFMLEHFRTSAAAYLCTVPEDRDKNISIKTLKDIMSVPSVSKIEIGNEKISKLVIEKLEQIDRRYEGFCVLIRVLHSLVCELPNKPLGKTLGELAEYCLREPVVDCEEYALCFRVLQHCSKEELLLKIATAIDILKEYNLPLLKEFSSRLALLRVQVSSSSVEVEKIAKPLSLSTSDRYQLREKMQDMFKNNAFQKTEFYLKKIETLECFTHYFKRYLIPLTNEPFHEIFTFNPSSKETKQYQLALSGPGRIAMKTGLTQPHKYLGCKCCITSVKDPYTRSLPDLNRCYKLLQEYGTLVNLYDWMQAFATQLSDSDDQNEDDDIDPEIHARFIQAVSELQFLGFVKPTKRKTHHVEKIRYAGFD